MQASLWPPETNWVAVTPAAGSKLRALYLGEIEPQDIARNLVGYSLYSDELFTVDPFPNPWHLQPKYNPIDNPDQYKSDTLRLIYFLFAVSPWIRSGLLQLIPDPSDFYPGLRQEIWRRAKERRGDAKPAAEDLAEGHARGREEMSRVIRALPSDRLFRLAEQATGKALTDKQKSALLHHVRKKLSEDPLAYEQPLTKDGQLNVFRSGANLETALIILNQTGAFPYTAMKTRWEELMSVRDQMSTTARLWSPLTRAFQALEFRFLDNVNVEFAEQIRQDGRLETFRTLLRRVGKDAESIDDASTINSYVRDVTGELSSEYQKARAEWNKIEEGFLRWVGISGVGVGLVTGHLWPDISAFTVGAGNAISQLLFRVHAAATVPPYEPDVGVHRSFDD